MDVIHSFLPLFLGARGVGWEHSRDGTAQLFSEISPWLCVFAESYLGHYLIWVQCDQVCDDENGRSIVACTTRRLLQTYLQYKQNVIQRPALSDPKCHVPCSNVSFTHVCNIRLQIPKPRLVTPRHVSPTKTKLGPGWVTKAGIRLEARLLPAMGNSRCRSRSRYPRCSPIAASLSNLPPTSSPQPLHYE